MITIKLLKTTCRVVIKKICRLFLFVSEKLRKSLLKVTIELGTKRYKGLLNNLVYCVSFNIYDFLFDYSKASPEEKSDIRSEIDL